MRSAFYTALIIATGFFLYFWYMVAYAMYDVAREKQVAFVTDQCTLFPEGSWSECCEEHDLAYWQGGHSDMREATDIQFKMCVQDKTQNVIFANVIYTFVRMGGTPYFATPWRWGYGWKFGRGYR